MPPAELSPPTEPLFGENTLRPAHVDDFEIGCRPISVGRQQIKTKAMRSLSDWLLGTVLVLSIGVGHERAAKRLLKALGSIWAL